MSIDDEPDDDGPLWTESMHNCYSDCSCIPAMPRRAITLAPMDPADVVTGT